VESLARRETAKVRIKATRVARTRTKTKVEKATETRTGGTYGVQIRTDGKDKRIGARKSGKITLRPHHSNNLHQAKTERTLRPLKDCTSSASRMQRRRRR